MKSARTLLAAALLCTAAFPAAHAEVTRPSITIGGGLESAPTDTSDPQLKDDAVNVLLRVGIDGVGVHAKGFHFVIARIRGDIAVSTDDAGSRIPYMDIDFVPVQVALGDGVSGSKIGVLPTEAGINVRLDEKLKVRVDLVRFEKNYLGPSHISECALLYAKLAADALGYKMATHLSSAGGFYGGNIAAIQAEVGLVFALGHHINARISFGGNADVSLGENVGSGFAVESDMQAYNEVSLDVTRFLRFFIRNGVNAVVNSGDGIPNRTEYQLLAGATFIY